MTKQEQIEEMANYYREYRKKQTGEKFYEFIDDKVPDNVVVLTGRVAGRTGDIWRQAQEKTRKETAKEFAEKLKIKAIRLSEIENYHVCNLIDELLKEYEK